MYDEKTEGKLEKFKKNNFIRFKIKYSETLNNEYIGRIYQMSS